MKVHFCSNVIDHYKSCSNQGLEKDVSSDMSSYELARWFLVNFKDKVVVGKNVNIYNMDESGGAQFLDFDLIDNPQWRVGTMSHRLGTK